MTGSDLPHDAHVAALACLDGAGPARLRWLLGLGAPAQVWQLVRSGSLPLGSGPVDAAQRAAWARQSARLDPAELWHRCERDGIGVVTLGAPAYPHALRGDPDPPVVLFHRGDPDVLAGPRVAIVGTRRATGYGRRHAARLAAELTAAGVSVVSGLALGIDAAAHGGAVQVDGAPPVAVVGGGLDAPCPRRNLALAHTVAELGVVLSEVPPGVPASPWRFPVRNRVIAGLAQAVVVVESAGAGGSMHTVRAAMSRDVPVMAVPGPIDSRASEGTNGLIADGALVCGRVEDVLMAIGHVVSPSRAQQRLPLEHRPEPQGHAADVLEHLGWRPVSIEQLAGVCGLDFAQIAAAVHRLQVDGWVQRHGGWVERIALAARVPGDGGDAA